MKYSVIILAVALMVSYADMGDVISTIPAPGGNPDGLTWIDGSLWITSDDNFMIYKINPSTGAIQDSIVGYGEDTALTGLSYDGTYLLSNCDPWIYFRELSGGAVVDSIPGPATVNEGLAWDGSSIWSTNWSDNLVYELDPTNGDILSFFFPQAPADYDGLTGLAYDGFFLWISDQDSKTIMCCVPGDPIPWEFFLAPCDTPQDLAWDGTYLWVTEYESSGAMVYQLDPGPGALTPATWGFIKTEF